MVVTENFADPGAVAYVTGVVYEDLNGNGVVDGGSELFGTESGDGFGDLARFDSDGNGWIDENDPIFKGLRIWSKTEGEDRLIALGEAGIGAIYLGAARTDYTLRGESAAALGQLRQTGFFLKEDGDAGLIQQIDLAVEESTPKEPENGTGPITVRTSPEPEEQKGGAFSKAGLIRLPTKAEVDPELVDGQEQMELLARKQLQLTGELSRLEGERSRMGEDGSDPSTLKRLENRLLLVRQSVAAVEGRLFLLKTGSLDLTG